MVWERWNDFSWLFCPFGAKPGKEEELAAFLTQGLELANRETTTPLWFALRSEPEALPSFDAFADEAGRQAHLNGPIAKALGATADGSLDVKLTTPKEFGGSGLLRDVFGESKTSQGLTRVDLQAPPEFVSTKQQLCAAVERSADPPNTIAG
jgi:hypothetical protein